MKNIQINRRQAKICLQKHINLNMKNKASATIISLYDKIIDAMMEFGSKLSEKQIAKPEVKKAEEILEIIAKKHEYDSWKEMVWVASRNRREEYIIEAIEFASQFQEQPITDEMIITYFNNHSACFNGNIGSLKVPSMTRGDFIDAIKWALSLKAQKAQPGDEEEINPYLLSKEEIEETTRKRNLGFK